MATKFDKIAGEYREAEVVLRFTDRDHGLGPFREAVAELVDLGKVAIDVRVQQLQLPLET
ncbi:MAG: hypothetical protein ACRDHY_15200 [Anaerolineales bacterium]